MANGKNLFAAAVATASLCAFAGTSQAVTAAPTIYVESPSDAGQTLTTAQTTAIAGAPAGSTLSEITGTFTSASDADLFLIDITSPSTFSASTVNAASAAQDTELFLFSSTGTAIAANDDSSGTSFEAALPAGNSLYANLAAGTYYLGISESGNEPVNSASQLLFNGYPGGDTTAVRGAATKINPTTLSTFNSNEYDTTTSGAYEIDLTGAGTAGTITAAVPEPSTWAAVGASCAALAFLRRRRVA